MQPPDKPSALDDFSSPQGVLPCDFPQSFPQQLMEVLSMESLSDIITWLPHGEGWIILDKRRFESEVLPKYFEKKSKWTSFTRKLNRWSFTRVTRGEEVGAYYHPLFQRGNKQLCLQMTCMSTKMPQSVEPLNPVALGLATPQMIERGLFSRSVQIESSVPSSQILRQPTELTHVAHTAPSSLEPKFADPTSAPSSSMTQLHDMASQSSSSPFSFPFMNHSSQLSQVSSSRSHTPDLNRFFAGEEEDTISLSPNPLALARHIQPQFRQHPPQAPTTSFAFMADPPSNENEFHSAALYTKVSAQGGLESAVALELLPHRYQDIPTSTPLDTALRRVDGTIFASKQDAEEGNDYSDRETGYLEAPEEQQTISPSLFDSTSSDHSSLDGTRITINPTTFEDGQKLYRGSTSQVDAAQDVNNSEVESTRLEKYRTRSETQQQHQNAIIDSLLSLHRNFMAAAMMIDQKNHVQEHQSSQRERQGTASADTTLEKIHRVCKEDHQL